MEEISAVLESSGEDTREPKPSSVSMVSSNARKARKTVTSPGVSKCSVGQRENQ